MVNLWSLDKGGQTKKKRTSILTDREILKGKEDQKKRNWREVMRDR